MSPILITCIVIDVIAFIFLVLIINHLMARNRTLHDGQEKWRQLALENKAQCDLMAEEIDRLEAQLGM